MNRKTGTNLIRTIRRTWNRYLAIFAITALGVGFLTGLLCTAPDMKMMVDRFYDAQNFMDIDIKASMGLTEEDIREIRDTEGVLAVTPVYQRDEVVTDDSGENRTIRLICLDPAEMTGDSVNAVTLEAGRLPERVGECVLVQLGPFQGGAQIGESLHLPAEKLVKPEEKEDASGEEETEADSAEEDGTEETEDEKETEEEKETEDEEEKETEDDEEEEKEDGDEEEDEEDEPGYRTAELTVTGIVTAPFVVSAESEATSVGSGTVSAYYYVLPELIDTDLYTDAWVTLTDSSVLDTFSDEYQDMVDLRTDTMKALGDRREPVRYGEIVAEAESKVDEAESDYRKEREEAESELADARQELAEASSEIADGEQELADGRQELDDAWETLAEAREELTEAESELADGKKELEDAEKELADGRKELEDAEKELADGKEELDDARKELNKGKSELDSAKKELKSAKKELKKAKSALDEAKPGIEQARTALADTPAQIEAAREAIVEYESGMAEYEAGKKELAASRKKLDKGWKEYSAAQEAFDRQEIEAEGSLMTVKGTLDLAKQQLDAGEKELKSQQKKLNKAKKKLEKAEAAAVLVQAKQNSGEKLSKKEKKALSKFKAAQKEVKSADKALAKAEKKWNRSQSVYEKSLREYKTQKKQVDKELKAAKKELKAARKKLEKGEKQYLGALSVLEEAGETLQASKGQISEARKAIAEWEENQPKLESAVAEYEAGEQKYLEGKKKYEDGKAEYEKGKKKYEDGLKEYEDGKKEYEDGLKEYEDGKKEYEDGLKEYEDGKKEYEDGKKEYADGLKEYEDGLKEAEDGEREYEENVVKLADAKQEYADGLADYEEAEQEALDKFAEAEEKIADARAKIAEIDMPEWYVLDRNANVTYASFISNVDKVTAISKVFPVFFFLVAALVALTTMTRMVEEERTEIGTMKALGYSGSRIASKYVIYAGSAAVLGSITGVLVGQWLFPVILWNAYEIMYYFPGFKSHFIPRYAVPSALAAIVSVLAATWWAIASHLRENPARLMLPKAPKAGKRIWLEYVTPVWKRLRFTGKVTMRNLFRYKKRFLMTVIGIGGCTALLVTGFGIRDSIGHIVEIQFADLQKYSLTVSLNSDAGEEERQELEEHFRGAGEEFLAVHTEVGTAVSGKHRETVWVEVPEDADAFSGFVDLRNRLTGEKVAFDASSVILTEKLADTMGVKPGDRFILENTDDEQVEMTVTGITENYIRGFVYVGKEAWKEAWGEAADTDAYLVKSPAEPEQEEAEITEILTYDGAAQAQFSSGVIETFDNMLNKIDYIVYVLIICAGLLAFVVLYNLTNINISERQKEIATIKVLGFHRNEVRAYIYRETVLLSIFGILAGLVMGFFLHRFVILTVEVSAIMFGRRILPMSYVYSAVITLIFTGLVCLAMSGRLRRISMVESLKSVD